MYDCTRQVRLLIALMQHAVNKREAFLYCIYSVLWLKKIYKYILLLSTVHNWETYLSLMNK